MNRWSDMGVRHLLDAAQDAWTRGFESEATILLGVAHVRALQALEAAMYATDPEDGLELIAKEVARSDG